MFSRLLTYSSSLLSATFVIFIFDFDTLPAAAVLAAPIIRRICKQKKRNKSGQPGSNSTGFIPPCYSHFAWRIIPLVLAIGGFIPFGNVTRYLRSSSMVSNVTGFGAERKLVYGYLFIFIFSTGSFLCLPIIAHHRTQLFSTVLIEHPLTTITTFSVFSVAVLPPVYPVG